MIQAAEGATLIISYIGDQAQEVIIGAANMLQIRLVEDVSQLDEVIVVGYGTQRKSFAYQRYLAGHRRRGVQGQRA